MEDYQAAFLQRHTDTEKLCHSDRKVAAMHFGGITIECLLKAMILASLPKRAKREWKTDSNNPKHTITNPGHSFQDALKRYNKLYEIVQKTPGVMNWLIIVENPNNQHFIHMRYSSSESDEPNYKQWLFAYNSLRGWLQKQATKL
jgi:hypothetical protein